MIIALLINLKYDAQGYKIGYFWIKDFKNQMMVSLNYKFYVCKVIKNIKKNFSKLNKINFKVIKLRDISSKNLLKNLRRDVQWYKYLNSSTFPNIYFYGKIMENSKNNGDNYKFYINQSD